MSDQSESRTCYNKLERCMIWFGQKRCLLLRKYILPLANVLVLKWLNHECRSFSLYLSFYIGLSHHPWVCPNYNSFQFHSYSDIPWICRRWRFVTHKGRVHPVPTFNAWAARAKYTTAYPIAVQFPHTWTQLWFACYGGNCCAWLIFWHVIHGCLYNKALVNVWSTGEGIEYLLSSMLM